MYNGETLARSACFTSQCGNFTRISLAEYHSAGVSFVDMWRVAFPRPLCFYLNRSSRI